MSPSPSVWGFPMLYFLQYFYWGCCYMLWESFGSSKISWFFNHRTRKIDGRPFMERFDTCNLHLRECDFLSNKLIYYTNMTTIGTTSHHVSSTRCTMHTIYNVAADMFVWMAIEIFRTIVLSNHCRLRLYPWNITVGIRTINSGCDIIISDIIIE